jgi:hypothetical protein
MGFETNEGQENLPEQELKGQLVRLESNAEALQREMPQNPTDKVQAKIKEFWSFLEDHEDLTMRLSCFVGGLGGGALASGGSVEGMLAAAGAVSGIRIGLETLDKWLRRNQKKIEASK